MPLLLKGSCRCRAVRFEVESHTPAPYQLCYCSICRKQQGGGGYVINLGAVSDALKITGKRHLGVYRAEIEDDEHPHCEVSTGERNSAGDAARRSGSTTRPGPNSSILSRRRSIPTCRYRRKRRI